MVMSNFEDLPDLVLSHVVEYLCPEDTARLSQTCHRLHSLLPQFLIIRGKDFCIRGPSSPHWAPELYFDGPPLPSIVKKLSLFVLWKDQGWGNRKGEIFLQLMRTANAGAAPMEVVQKRKVFGIADHEKKKTNAELANDPIVTLAKPGDFYRFMRNAGGGGGHSLTVENFKVIATLSSS